MKSVGLLSLPRYENYGSQLQLWALQTAIEKLGYGCEVIDYVAPPPPPIPLVQRLWRIVKSPSAFFDGLARRRYLKHERSLTGTRSRLFDDFSRELLHLGPKEFASAEALLADPPQYDACVVGSDQVWNPKGHFGDPSFYLTFADARRRVAYAPSIGLSEIPADAASWMREMIAGIECLSIREEQGAALIRQLTSRDAQVVTDPTLLHTADDWNRIATPSSRTRPYVLVYALQADAYVREHVRAIAERHGLDIVVLPFHESDVLHEHAGVSRAFDVGPREFVGLVRDAALICTDSFHGTVFSVIYRRPFLTFRRYDHAGESATFSRMSDFLARLGLSERSMDRTTALPASLMAVDYSDVTPVLDAWRASSWAFLGTSLAHASAGSDGAPATAPHG